MTEKKFCSRCGSRLPDHELSCPRWQDPAGAPGSASYPQARWERGITTPGGGKPAGLSPLPFDSLSGAPAEGPVPPTANEREIQLIRERLLEERTRTGVAPPRKAAGQRRSVRTGFAALAAAAIAAVLFWSPWTHPASSSVAAGPTTSDAPEVAGVRDVRDDDARPLEESQAAAPLRTGKSSAAGGAQSETDADLSEPAQPALRGGAGRPPAPLRRQAPAAQSEASPAAASSGEGSFGEARATAATAAPSAALAPPTGSDPSGGSSAAARTQIQSAVGGYARAVESRDVRQLRRVYPQLPRQEEQNWREFFASVRDLNAKLDVASLDVLDVANSTAVVRITGTYSYRNQTLGRDERSPVDFQATLRRGSGGWFFSSVR